MSPIVDWRYMNPDQYEELIKFIDNVFDDYSDWECNYYETYIKTRGILIGYCFAKNIRITLVLQEKLDGYLDIKCNLNNAENRLKT